jgi:hypothetical protein
METAVPSMALVWKLCSETTRIIIRTQCRTIMSVAQDHGSIYVSPEAVVKVFKNFVSSDEVHGNKEEEEVGNVGSEYESENSECETGW